MGGLGWKERALSFQFWTVGRRCGSLWDVSLFFSNAGEPKTSVSRRHTCSDVPYAPTVTSWWKEIASYPQSVMFTFSWTQSTWEMAQFRKIAISERNLLSPIQNRKGEFLRSLFVFLKRKKDKEWEWERELSLNEAQDVKSKTFFPNKLQWIGFLNWKAFSCLKVLSCKNKPWK